MKITVNRNTIFTALLALTVALILVRITPVSVDPVVKLTITKNRTNISNIYQPRDVEFVKEVMVDRLNLLDKSRFSHPKLGNVAGYSDDFFVDVDRKFRVTETGNYRFMVGSDDGFSLTIDDKLICEFRADRPFTIQPCLLQLTKGEHRFRLSYFQGFGNSGLTVEYAREDGKEYWFGDNSKYIKFD